MRRRRLAWALLALWAAVWTASVAVPALSPPEGMGLTRGLNRVTSFYGWQIGAAFLAVAVWAAGRAFEPGSAARWLSRLPAALAALLAAATLAFVLWARYGIQPPPPGPPPAVPTPPRTAPG